MTVPDTNLRAKIVEALDKPSGETPTAADMLTLTTLTATNANIRDLTGLQHAPNLKTVSLDNNNISDAALLAGLPQLTSLALDKNNISDVASLEALTQLETLSLNDNNISDVTPLTGMVQLKTLSLENNSISDVSPLEALTQLKTLHLRGNLLNYPSLHTHIPAIQTTGATVTIDLRTPTTLVQISGTHGVAGAALPLIVEVQDENGFGFSGVPVTFTVTAGGGQLSASKVITDATGRARTTLTLGSTPGKNTVRTTVVETPQPVSFTITAVDASSVVTIRDANLRAKIAETLGRSRGVQLTAGDMLALTRLEVPNANIQNLIGLEHAHNLTSLNLGGAYIRGKGYLNSNKVSDFSPLEGLTQLTRLSLFHSFLSDVSFLSALTQLTWLDLRNNDISDVSALSGLTQLNTLYLYNNSISDVSALVSALSSLTRLRELRLGGNAITDVSALAGLTQLNSLSLYGISISDVSALVSVLSNLTQLRELNLGGNAITDVSALAGLTQLNRLHLYSNSISDVSALSTLTQLTHTSALTTTLFLMYLHYQHLYS